MMNLATQQTKVVTVQEREKKVERDMIDRKISALLEERSVRSRFLGTQGPIRPCTHTFGLCGVVRLGTGTLQEKRKSSARISQIDAELAVLRTKLARLKYAFDKSIAKGKKRVERKGQKRETQLKRR